MVTSQQKWPRKCRRCDTPVSEAEFDVSLALIMGELHETVESARKEGLTDEQIRQDVIASTLRDIVVCPSCFAEVNQRQPLSSFITGDNAKPRTWEFRQIGRVRS